jgi:phenylacetate-CoA ligase
LKVVCAASASEYFSPATETLERSELRALQLRRIGVLLDEVLPNNRFYARKFGPRPRLASWGDFEALPFTTKPEIAVDQYDAPPYGTNLTYGLERYIKFHQTSGTTGKAPIRWLDTEESWDWWAHCWGHVFRGAGVGPGDRVFYAFSFGPFIGFWAAYEGARKVGAMTVPGGGMQTEQRLQAMADNAVTVLCCTPTYALRMAEVAHETGVDLAGIGVKATVHAGEPGASVPGVRARIEQAYGARCHDHTGMTELGATGFTCGEQDGVHLIESEFVFEVIDPTTCEPVADGEQGELVATNLGRAGMPLIRYRTGDLVELNPGPCACGRTFARLKGGILGRADDMVIVRGMNIFPSAIEGVLREFPEINEFRIEISQQRSMEELRVLIDAQSGVDDALARRVGDRLHDRLLLRVPCELVPAGSLPRFELKARRVVRL